MSVVEVHVVENPKLALLGLPTQLPPLWVLLYMGSVIAAGVAGSVTDTVAGMNIEHVFLGAALGLAVLFLLFEGNFRQIEGLNRVLKYLALFGLAVFLGFLSSIHPGPKIVGGSALIYWCGLIVSIGVAAMAALTGHTRWILAAVVLTGIPVSMSVLQTVVPFLGAFIPLERLHASEGVRVTGLFSDPNSTGFSLYCSYASCLVLLLCVRSRLLKYICLLVGLVYVVAAFMTLSRISILLTALTTLVFLYIRWREMNHRWAVFLVLCASVLPGVYRLSNDFDLRSQRQIRFFDESLYGGDTFRFRGLVGAVHRIDRLFLLGEGSGQFTEKSHVYLKGFSHPHISIYGKAPHSQLLGIFVEWGFLALLLVYSAHTWVVIRSLRHCYWQHSDLSVMLLTAYVCILLNLQSNSYSSPASCALLGLLAGPALLGLHGDQRSEHSDRGFVLTTPISEMAE